MCITIFSSTPERRALRGGRWQRGAAFGRAAGEKQLENFLENFRLPLCHVPCTHTLRLPHTPSAKRGIRPKNVIEGVIPLGWAGWVERRLSEPTPALSPEWSGGVVLFSKVLLCDFGRGWGERLISDAVGCRPASYRPTSQIPGVGYTPT